MGLQSVPSAALEAFRGITDAVSGEADLRSVLELVADRSSALISVDRCAVSSSRSVRATADVVGVHENTIRYRLARIAELTGMDVATNADDQLAGQLATLVLRLEGVLHASPAVVATAA